jgi:DNA-binding response OmpR family regulator
MAVCSVLVIDDEKMVRELLQSALRRVNFNVETAEDAVGGISKFDSGQFDLVITDVCMPGPDGHDVVQHIRGSKRQATPVIGVSGTPWLVQHSEFDDVLYKPFSIFALIEKARSLTRYPLAG